MRKTCVETLKEIQAGNPEHPILIKPIRSDKEIAFIVNDNQKWDMYVYKSHGFVFVKIAKNLTDKTVIKLKNKIKTW